MNEEEENSYSGEQELIDKKSNHDTSILERHEKIPNNIINSPESPMNNSSFSSIGDSKGNINENDDKNNRHHAGFNISNTFNNNVISRKVTSIKTEKDIAEDIKIESSHEDNKNKEEIEDNIIGNQQLLIDLPQSFLNSVKYLRMKHQKEQLNSFMKFNKTPEPNKEQQLLITPNANKSINDGRSILKKSTKKNTNDIPDGNGIIKGNSTPLPRIASASNLSNQMTLQKPQLAKIKSKHIKIGIPYHNQNIKLVHKEDKQLLQLEQDYKTLFSEVQAVNQQLNILINKRLKQKPELKTWDSMHQNEIKEIEKNSLKKTLARLIDEYNQLYKVYYVCKDNDSKNKLEDQLNQITKQYNDKLKINQDLQNKIKMNEYYLLNSKSEQVSIVQNIALLDSKNELLKKKAKEEEREYERKQKLIVKEEERITMMKDKLIKLKEILTFYEETPESILHKDTEMGEKNKLSSKYELLKKKSNIIQHSRISSSKTYQIDIGNQKKDIDHLQRTIKEVNDILDSFN